jgi:hypothetical protein
MADVEILAEIALQIAMGEENGSGPVLADQRGFFTEMGMISVNDRLIGGFADSFLTAQPVDAAFSGAKLAGLKDFGGLPNFVLQQPALQCVDITGSVVVH